MKIDMSPRAVTLCLKQVEDLRRVCLVLADSSVGRKIRERLSGDKKGQRAFKTGTALLLS